MVDCRVDALVVPRLVAFLPCRRVRVEHDDLGFAQLQRKSNAIAAVIESKAAGFPLEFGDQQLLGTRLAQAVEQFVFPILYHVSSPVFQPLALLPLTLASGRAVR